MDWHLLPGGRGRGNSYVKGGCLLYLKEVKKVALVPIRVSSLEKPTAGSVVVPFRLLSRKKSWSVIHFALELVTLKRDFKPCLQNRIKISNKHPCSFSMGVPFPGYSLQMSRNKLFLHAVLW